MNVKKNTILVVDDEDVIRRMLSIFLDVSDFNVVVAETGKQALRMTVSLKPNLILLDLGLPDMDGKEVIASIREWSQVPIIVLTARAEDIDGAKALNLGAEDYVTKPFSAEILLARINANLRKATIKEVGEPEINNGPVKIDLVRHEVAIGDRRVPFTPKEYDLLRFLMINQGRMLTHKQILKEVWGPAHVENTQYLRVYISQVREKLDKPAGLGHLIISESGIGYRMDAHVAA
jgi:two-component system, OmpR family, KDP operon response regulator KdpE